MTSSNTSPELCDMPPEVIESIVERLPDIESRRSLRNSCKGLREIVDDSKLVLENLSVQLETRNYIRIRFNEYKKDFLYDPLEGECRVPRYNCIKQNNLETAVNYLMTILKNPKLIIKTLAVTNYDNSQNRGHPFFLLLNQKLTGLNHKLHVEHAKFIESDENKIMLIMQLYKPGTLRKLELGMNSKDQLTKIFNLDQWKQAEHLISTVIRPMDEILHFKKVDPFLADRKTDRIPWDEFKRFLEKLIAQADHSVPEFSGKLVHAPDELKEYVKDMERIGESTVVFERVVLKTLANGSRLVLIFWLLDVKIEMYPKV